MNWENIFKAQRLTLQDFKVTSSFISDMKLSDEKHAKMLEIYQAECKKHFFSSLFESLTNYAFKNDYFVYGDLELRKFQEYIHSFIDGQARGFDASNEKHINGLIKYMENHYQKYNFYIEDGMIKRIKYEPFTVTFVTKGKMVLTEYVVDYFEEEEDRSLERPIEIDINNMKRLANLGLYFGFCGNTCPQVFYSEELQKIQVGVEYKMNQYFSNDAQHYWKEEKVLHKSFKRIDKNAPLTWYYSLMEYDKAEELGILENVKHDIIEIPAGRWLLTHTGKITSEEAPYATIELITKM